MGVQVKSHSDSPTTLTEVFDRAFPFYLDLGMTYEMFYQKDVSLVRHYNAMSKIRDQRVNYSAWLYGLYYDHALLHRLSEMFTKSSVPYPEKPFEIEEKEEEEKLEEMTKEERAMYARMAIDKAFANKRGTKQQS